MKSEGVRPEYAREQQKAIDNLNKYFEGRSVNIEGVRYEWSANQTVLLVIFPAPKARIESARQALLEDGIGRSPGSASPKDLTTFRGMDAFTLVSSNLEEIATILELSSMVPTSAPMPTHPKPLHSRASADHPHFAYRKALVRYLKSEQVIDNEIQVLHSYTRNSHTPFTFVCFPNTEVAKVADFLRRISMELPIEKSLQFEDSACFRLNQAGVENLAGRQIATASGLPIKPDVAVRLRAAAGLSSSSLREAKAR